MNSKLELSSFGYLELFLGPMWAGKSSNLVTIYNSAISHDLKCIAINHVFDLSSKPSIITTHDDRSIPCISNNTLTNIFNTSDTTNNFDFDIILINEGQFFPDLYEWTKFMVNYKYKTIYIAALDGDYQQIGFNNILQLIPEADKITKLHNLCKECNQHWAIFTYRTSDETYKVLPGTKHYIPLCRKCYNKRI
jgi:thymidine kinase